MLLSTLKKGSRLLKKSKLFGLSNSFNRNLRHLTRRVFLLNASRLENSPPEGLPRYAQFSPTGILRGFDYFGTVVFAVSGSLTAALNGCDLLGCCLVGSITATGGGTIRDVFVLRRQPFWFVEWEYMLMSLVSAAGLFFYWGDVEPGKEIFPGTGLMLKSKSGAEGNLMLWTDAIGVGAFSVIGAMNGISASAPFVISATCGMMTATFGGVVRDVLLNIPPRILHPYSDAYAPIAFMTAASYITMRMLLPTAHTFRIVSSVSMAVLLRYLTWTNGWRLPYWDKGTHTVRYGSEDPKKRVNPKI